MIKVGKSGKNVLFKEWPGFNFTGPEAMKMPLNEKRKIV